MVSAKKCSQAAVCNHKPAGSLYSQVPPSGGIVFYSFFKILFFTISYFFKKHLYWSVIAYNVVLVPAVYFILNANKSYSYCCHVAPWKQTVNSYCLFYL